MKFLEKDLEEIIYETHTTDDNILLDKGIFIYGKMKRQLNIGGYGIADLVVFKRRNGFCPYEGHPVKYLCVTVYELKKDKIGVSAYFQAVKYVKGIYQYLNFRNFRFRVNFNIVLIGSKLDTSGSLCFLPDIPIFKTSLFTYSYGIDGIEFKEEKNYSCYNENFKR